MVPAGLSIAASTFDVGQFEQNIVEFLDGNVVGYAYAMNQNGALATSGADGDARTAADGQADFQADTRIEVASVSKTVTAVAVLKLLQDQNISVEDKIWPYLPTAWQSDMGPNITDIEFNDLLKHESGFRTSANSYEALQELISDGVDSDDYGDFQYLNANYTLLRVITPYLWRILP